MTMPAHDELQSLTVKETVAGQLAAAMKEENISKTRLAEMLKTSRWQLNRILDSESDVRLSTLERAAILVGRSVRVELQSQHQPSRSKNISYR